MKNKNVKKLLFLLLIPLAILIRYFLSLSPAFVEMYYSRGLYKFIMQPISLLTGTIPFSVAELVLVLLLVYIPARIIFLIVKAISQRKWKVFLPFTANVIIIASLWFFVQVVVWNINYERLPFSENAEIVVEESTIDDLEALCKWHIDNTNLIREHVSQDENGVMKVDGGYRSILERAQAGYTALEKHYPFLEGSYGKPKPVMLSRLMSHSNIIGIYSCLTGEANIDVDIPQMQIASTALHEMAHQRGFAREDEANYIAYAACIAHPDADFKYSGSSMALQYCMSTLYSENPVKYFRLIEDYSEGYQRDLQSINTYWQQFQGKTKDIADKMNDTYLKLNGQEDGVKSYGRMVDLLMAEYKHRIQLEE